MTLSPTDMIQSFRLRFWRESRQGKSEDWRGEVWHEQQEPDEEAVVVANPEAAFELVRQTLHFFSGTHDTDIPPAGPPGGGELGRASSSGAPLSPQDWPYSPLSIWRRIRGEQP
jgi:hypothetical protein